MSECHYLLAADSRAADGTAMIDWGWTRIGPHLFRDPEGNEVRYMPDGKDFPRGMPRGTKVYLGFEWYRRHDARHVKEALETGRIVEVPPTRTEAAIG